MRNERKEKGEENEKRHGGRRMRGTMTEHATEGEEMGEKD